MNRETSSSFWRPGAAQIGILGGALLLSVIYLTFMLQAYWQERNTAQTFADQSEALATLSNIQRHTVLLFVQTQDWLLDPSIGKGEIEKQRAFLNTQIRILRPLLTPQSETLQKIDQLTTALQEYDRLLESLGDTPSESTRAAARPQIIALLKEMDENLVKRAYDTKERTFTINFSAVLRQQERNHQLLISSAVLFILLFVTGSGFYLRSERQAFMQRQAYLQTLEKEVAERTKALQTAAAVSRRLSAVPNEGELVARVVEELQAAFNYYHAHIYLLDQNGETLRMAGGTGEAGRSLLQRGHSLPIGKGLVGRAAQTRQMVLVPDTSTDPNWLPNPLLTETKSEIAVPILAGDQVLGVLDVQNNRVNSLGIQDAELIGAVADQVAIALQTLRANVQAREAADSLQRLVESVPVAIAILDARTGVFIEANDNALNIFEIERSHLGQIGPIQLSPPQQPDGRNSEEKAAEQIALAMQTGAHTFEWLHRTAQGREFLSEIRLTRALDVRGQVVLNATITDITERRRQEEAIRKRAQQQEMLNQILQKIQSTASVEEALQITVRELGHALGKKPVLAALESASRSPEETN